METRLRTLTTATIQSSPLPTLEVDLLLLLHPQAVIISPTSTQIHHLPPILQVVVPLQPKRQRPPRLLPLPSPSNLFPPPQPSSLHPFLRLRTSTRSTTTSTSSPRLPSGPTSYHLRRISASRDSNSSRTTCASLGIQCEEEDRMDCGPSETRERSLLLLEDLLQGQDRS